MTLYIGIEDLAANALIEVLKTKENNLSHYLVSYAKLEEYGNKVVQYLALEKGKKAALILSRDSTQRMLHNYSDFFEETADETAIYLKKGKTVDELIRRFRTYLSFDVMIAFMADSTVQVLIK